MLTLIFISWLLINEPYVPNIVIRTMCHIIPVTPPGGAVVFAHDSFKLWVCNLARSHLFRRVRKVTFFPSQTRSFSRLLAHARLVLRRLTGYHNHPKGWRYCARRSLVVEKKRSMYYLPLYNIPRFSQVCSLSTHCVFLGPIQFCSLCGSNESKNTSNQGQCLWDSSLPLYYIPR